MADVQRNTVFGPVVASLKVNKDAEKAFFNQDNKTIQYWKCRRMVPGGVIEVFVFGTTTPGKTVSAKVELKTKLTRGKEVHYLRAEVCDEKPSYKLYAGSPDDVNIKIDPAMPSKVISEEGRRTLVGFVPIAAVTAA